MLALARFIDRLNGAIGRAAAFAVVAMALVQGVLVIGRYVFGLGSIWLQESILYLHALSFMLAAAATLARDGHVRVDIYRDRMSPRGRALVDLVGTLICLLPVCAVVFWTSLPYVGRAWAVLEGSKETAGIPAVFLLKTLIPVFAVLLALQGVSLAIRAARTVAGREEAA